MNKRYLLKIIVQPVWVEIDDAQNATELISRPTAVTRTDLAEYVKQLLELSDKTRRGEAISDG